nr:hypothetical protein [Helicobacter pylori]
MKPLVFACELLFFAFLVAGGINSRFFALRWLKVILDSKSWD